MRGQGHCSEAAPRQQECPPPGPGVFPAAQQRQQQQPRGAEHDRRADGQQQRLPGHDRPPIAQQSALQWPARGGAADAAAGQGHPRAAAVPSAAAATGRANSDESRRDAKIGRVTHAPPPKRSAPPQRSSVTPAVSCVAAESLPTAAVPSPTAAAKAIGVPPGRERRRLEQVLGLHCATSAVMCASACHQPASAGLSALGCFADVIACAEHVAWH